MAENVEGWGGAVKTVTELKPRYLFVFWFPCALLIFAPINFLERLGIASFVEQYRGWIGIISLVFFVLWLVQLYSTSIGWWKKKRENKESEKNLEEYKKSVLKYLNDSSLSAGEIFLICYALQKKQQVIFADYTNQHAQALLHKGILTIQGSGPLHNYPFLISDFVWDYLQKNRNEILPQKSDEKQKFLEMVERYDRVPTWQKDSMF